MSDRNDASDRAEQRSDGGRSHDRDEPREDDRRRDDAARDRRGSDTGYFASQFTETIVRVAVALIGVILLLLALSQIVGVDLYAVVGDIFASTVGQWLLVAIFGLLLILAASRRWTTTRG